MIKNHRNDDWMVKQSFITEIGFATSEELHHLERSGLVARRSIGEAATYHATDHQVQTDLFDLAWYKASMPKGVGRIGIPHDSEQQSLWAAALLRLIDLLHEVLDHNCILRNAILESSLPDEPKCIVNIAACERAMDREYARGADFSVVRFVAFAISPRAMEQPNGPTPRPAWKPEPIQTNDLF